jgi:ABC-type spermidine/putrescine transport system permease subunit II
MAATDKAPPLPTRGLGAQFAARVRAVPPVAVASGLPLLLWQVAFLLIPAVLLVVMTFWTVENFRLVHDYNVENWTSVIGSSVFTDVFMRTLKLSVLATVVSFALALPFAYSVAFKLRPTLRAIAIALLIAPFFTSYLVRIYSWNFLLAESGVLNYLLEKLGIEPVRLLGTQWAILIGYLSYFFPLLALVLILSLMNVDRRLIEAANNLGAGRWNSFRLVVLPSIRVGIVLALSFAFILAFGDPVSPQILGAGHNQTLANYLSAQVTAGVNYPAASVVAVVMLGVLLVVIFGTTPLAFPGQRRSKAADPERTAPAAPRRTTPAVARAAAAPAAPADEPTQLSHRQRFKRWENPRLSRVIDRVVDLGLWAYVALGFVFVYIPIVSLVVFSFADDRYPSLPWPGFTLDWYTNMSDDPEIYPALKNSVVIALIVGVVATALGAAAAYFLDRWEFRGQSVYLGLVIIGPCIPLVVLALSMLIFLREVNLAGSLTAVTISHVGLAAAFAVAIVRMRLTDMDRTLEKASWNLGAGELRTIWRVVLPQLAPALAAAFFLTMSISWNEFVVSWFVSGLDTTLPVKIFFSFQGNVSPRVNAVGSLVVGASFVMVALAGFFLVMMGRGSRRRRGARVPGSGVG